MLDITYDDEIWADAYGPFDPGTLIYSLKRTLCRYLRQEGPTEVAVLHCVAACELVKADLIARLASGDTFGTYGHHNR
jgi:hypothetical protein